MSGGAPDPAVLLYRHSYAGPLTVEGYATLKDAAIVAGVIFDSDHGSVDAIETVASDGTSRLYQGKELWDLADSYRPPPAPARARVPRTVVMVRAPAGLGCNEWAEVDDLDGYYAEDPHELAHQLTDLLGLDRVKVVNR